MLDDYEPAVGVDKQLTVRPKEGSGPPAEVQSKFPKSSVHSYTQQQLCAGS